MKRFRVAVERMPEHVVLKVYQYVHEMKYCSVMTELEGVWNNKRERLEYMEQAILENDESDEEYTEWYQCEGIFIFQEIEKLRNEVFPPFFEHPKPVLRRFDYLSGDEDE